MHSKAKTPTGRVVQHAVRSIRTSSPVGRIVVALGAEIGGALGDGVHRTFVNRGSGPSGGEADSTWRAEEDRRRAQRYRYTQEALREQREKRRQAEDSTAGVKGTLEARAENPPGQAVSPEARAVISAALMAILATRTIAHKRARAAGDPGHIASTVSSSPTTTRSWRSAPKLGNP